MTCTKRYTFPIIKKHYVQKSYISKITLITSPGCTDALGSKNFPLREVTWPVR